MIHRVKKLTIKTIPKQSTKSRKNKKNKKALTNNAITGADELFEQIENDNTFKSKASLITMAIHFTRHIVIHQ